MVDKGMVDKRIVDKGIVDKGMANKPQPPKTKSHFSHEVESKVTRKLSARRHRTLGVWFGLGMMGLIGWSVTVPTLLGAALGLWLDRHYPQQYSWTLALLVAGLMIGCWNAWHWIVKEDKEMQQEQENGHD
jgi:ATP synthase protein I